MDPMLNIGIKAAREASKAMIYSIDHLDQIKIEKKGRADYVSEIDRQAEKIIIETIHAAYPDHGILAEDSGISGDKNKSEHEWIIDPLDGTTNFLHGYPVYSVSIALRVKGELTVGIVYDPSRDELFSASKGKGAHLNNKRIRVSPTSHFSDALLATGFPYNDMNYLEPWMASFKSLVPHVAGVRRAGSAALDLAQVACGRFDGFWEFGLKSWDIAAGIILIQEAGGFSCDMKGDQRMLDTGHIIAGNAKLFKRLQTLVKEHAKGLENI
ncbi:MAG: inositol monophosphatase family protein [Arenicellales bacterium]